MKYVEGWWVPNAMSSANAFLTRAAVSEEALKAGDRMNICIQAGGHIGTYPIMLANWFKNVYTFEPNLENFECLVRNVSEWHERMLIHEQTEPDVGDIYPARGVLGYARGCVKMNRHKNSGGHSVEGEGNTPLYRIDDLALEACDLIHLDVEGYEMHALRGAIKTISTYKPIIVAEENKQQMRYGFKRGDIEKLLAPLGYKVVRRIDEDIILECA
jgi:FkbM family methyltransferase